MSQFLLFFGGGEQWARIFKKVQVKKTREIKLINFTKKFFWPNSIFCNFKNDQKCNFMKKVGISLI